VVVIKDTLKIGGHQVKVIYPHKFVERDDNHALIDHAANEIRIAGGRANSNVQVSLIHEILHRINAITGEFIFPEGDNLESQIEALSEALYQVLHDNKLRF